jgi:transcription elongation factor Elf1
MKISRTKISKATHRYGEKNCHRCNAQASVVFTIRKPRDLKQSYAVICEDCARPYDEIITVGIWLPKQIKNTLFEANGVH